MTCDEQDETGLRAAACKHDSGVTILLYTAVTLHHGCAENRCLRDGSKVPLRWRAVSGGSSLSVGFIIIYK